MATGYAQAAFESVAGNETNTPTLSTKKIYFPAMSVKPSQNPEHMSRDDEIRNADEPLSVLTEAYDPAWEFESRMYPDSLGWYLKLLLGSPVTTAGDGIITDPDAGAIPATAYRHVWTAPFGPSGASPLTQQMQVSYKDQNVFYKMKGCAAEKLSIESPDKGGCMIKANGQGLYMNRQADPSLTPSYESLAVRPFTRSGLTLPTWLSGSGTHENVTLEISNPIETVRSMGIESKSPDVMEKGEDLITVTGTLAQRQLDADDWDALVNATGFAAKAKWNSESVIASGYTYKLFVEFSNAQYVGGDPDALTNKRRHGAEFQFKSTYAGAASTTITLVNATASYA